MKLLAAGTRSYVKHGKPLEDVSRGVCEAQANILEAVRRTEGDKGTQRGHYLENSHGHPLDDMVGNHRTSTFLRS